MAGDTESTTEILERHLKKAGQYSGRVNARSMLRRQEQREERLFRKKQRALDDKLGTTDGLVRPVWLDSEDPRDRVVTQEKVDEVRANVTMRTLVGTYRRLESVDKWPVQYLWYATDDMCKVEIRDGNPPADRDRPKHLKGVQLVLDYDNAPEVLKRLCMETAKALNNQHAKLREGTNPIKRALQDDQILARVLKDKLGAIRG
jgi:hypothetical protein